MSIDHHIYQGASYGNLLPRPSEFAELLFVPDDLPEPAVREPRVRLACTGCDHAEFLHRRWNVGGQSYGVCVARDLMNDDIWCPCRSGE